MIIFYVFSNKIVDTLIMNPFGWFVGFVFSLRRCFFFFPLFSLRQGFELEFDPVVARLFSACKDSDKLDHAVRSLVERYLSVEDLFAGKSNEDGVIADLIKAHKDDPEVRAR